MYIGRLLTPKQNLLGACFTLSATAALSHNALHPFTHTHVPYIFLPLRPECAGGERA